MEAINADPELVVNGHCGGQRLTLALSPRPWSPSLMTTASTSSWMPQVGQCKVKAGSSIRRALNQRSGKATAPSKFDRDYFAFRCMLHSATLFTIMHGHIYTNIRQYVNFYLDNNKPPSIDSSKAGTLAVRKGQDVTNVQVEFPSQVRQLWSTFHFLSA